MIVCTTQPLYRYSGLSTDVKPTKDIKDASTFWETDTGKEFEWRKDAWYPRPVPTVIVDIPALESIQVSNFPDETLSAYTEIENAEDVVTTVDLSNPVLLSIASVSASVGKTATTTVVIGATSLVITRSVA